MLHEFNQEYRRRRLEAQRRGERFMVPHLREERRCRSPAARNAALAFAATPPVFPNATSVVRLAWQGRGAWYDG